MPPSRTPLPIDAVLADVVAALRAARNVVVEAPPGAGKTTRVPSALLDAGLLGDGEVIVLQPRRIAARLAARRVADERGERLGETVGYQVRFEESSSARTRIRFVTEGILTRRLLGDHALRGVSAVILDEFHERHLAGDVALALLKRLQRTVRPDLAIVVMSATLEAEPVVRYLDGAQSVRSEGRRFDVAIEHLAKPDARPLAMQVASALGRALGDGLDGDVLVFLPGADEIRRAREACESLAARNDLLLLPLHGSLSPAEQDRAVGPASKRKVILSTNVAETSVTIDGIVLVIDSGVARIASHAPWSGLPVLRVGPVSRASAIQRAGRAGRTRPGRCFRLFTRHEFDVRPEHDTPEIRRMDLSETVLEMRASGVSDVLHFDWFEPPPAAALEAAELLLRRLGALDASLEPTTIGRRMLRFPVHPRQARMLVEGETRGVAKDACAIAALVGEREIRSQRGPNRARGRAASDLIESLELFEAARSDGPRAIGVDVGAVNAVERVRAQLARAVTDGTPPGDAAEYENALLRCVLAGYADRVAMRRRPANATGRDPGEIVFAYGGTAVLAESSVVRDSKFLVAIDAEQRTDGRTERVMVREASAIEADWLLETFTDAVTDTTDVEWNASGERVEVTRRLKYGALVLDESAGDAVDDARVADVLADAALAKGIAAFVDIEAWDLFANRVSFLRAQSPALALPIVDASATRDVLVHASRGARTFRDLRANDLVGALRSRLTPEQQRALDAMCPERVVLPGGRRAGVRYPPGGAPFVESRLQDFFGMTQGPAILGGSVPLVLHLLAPNHRAVQVTTDLAGFWDRHYPAISRELRRKYPRHAWPDDPRTANPPQRTR